MKLFSYSIKAGEKIYKKIAYFIRISIFYILLNLILFGNAVPLTIRKLNLESFGKRLQNLNSTTSQYIPFSGCRYQSETYNAGDEVVTKEPCLKCNCKNHSVVCKLRICPPVPSSPPTGCIVVHKAKTCCPFVECPETRKISREQRLSTGKSNVNHSNESYSTNSQDLIHLPSSSVGQGSSCVMDGTIYAEGSAMKSYSDCEHCFCIRGQMKCSKLECVIPLQGCKPRFRLHSCCPTNYDCRNESSGSGVVKSTPPTSPLPSFLRGCRVRGLFVYEGEPVMSLNLIGLEISPCESCFCMGGVVRCRPLSCDAPIEGCDGVKEPGACCPSRYICKNNTEIGGGVHIFPGRERYQGIGEKNNVVRRIGAKETEDKNKEAIEMGSLPQKTGSRGPLFSLTQRYFESLKFIKGDARENTRVDEGKISGREVEERRGIDSIKEKTTDLDKSGDRAKGGLIIYHRGSGQVPVRVRGDLSGSREERRNKEVRGSYEDDEKDDLIGVPSLETIQRQINSSHDLYEPTSVPPVIETDSTDLMIEETTLAEITSQKNYAQEPTTKKVETTSSPISPAPITNVNFISFGVEDALLSPHEQINKTSSSTFSTINHLEKILIPPTPPRGYVHVPLIQNTPKETSGESLDSVNKTRSDKNESDLITHAPYVNVIMDVPVSTSLYNNGFYQNGIITKVETSNSSFPGLIFDDSSELTGPITQAPVVEMSSSPKSHFKKIETTTFVTTLPTTENPSRIYSKFGLGDVPQHGYRYEKNPDEDPLYEDEEPSLDETQNFEPIRDEGEKLTTSGFEPIRVIDRFIKPPGVSKPLLREESFKPLITFPFSLPQKPIDIGLKLSGCNIYGKMYGVGQNIPELSSLCAQCSCSEIGVQCTEMSC